MGIVGEDLEGNRVDKFALFVLHEIEVDEVVDGKRLARHGIGTMFQQPRQDVVQIEDCAFDRTDRDLERLEGNGAEVEGEAFESGVGLFRGGKASASAGGVAGIRGPFAMCDLRQV